jgi:hypothetical protein
MTDQDLFYLFTATREGVGDIIQKHLPTGSPSCFKTKTNNLQQLTEWELIYLKM